MEWMRHCDYPARMFEKCIVFAVLLVGPNSLIGRTVHYDPAVVECKGKLTLRYFPGPPNYESVKDGDAKEGAYILELDKPFDIEPTRNPHEPPNTDWEKNIRVVQLVLLDNSPKDLRKSVGKNISVRGRLFHEFTGHHHTRILMELDSLLGD